MKEGDSRLIYSFKREFGSSGGTPDSRAALFYPSADIDLLTPIILGLPYCTQFYFFERSRAPQLPRIAGILKDIPDLEIPRVPRQPVWTRQPRLDKLEFEYLGIPRTVHWVHDDNIRFLDLDVDLAFYFHRGDSPGEGGAGQKWDSDLLLQLTRKVPAEKSCLILTDGEPGGLDGRVVRQLRRLTTPFIERGRTYYAGHLSGG
jgi:hypothetical protein